MREFSSQSRARMKRRWKKAVFRLKHLPAGLDALRYLSNKVHQYFLQKIRSTRVAHPSSIMIEVTNHCNLKCITCPREYAYGEEMDKGFIPLTQISQLLDQAYPYVDSIGLTGLGETMLYKDLVKAVELIKNRNKGIIISISVNAHLPKSVEITEQLMGKIDTIQVSIDGIGPVYEQVRKQGDYQFFKENLSRMAAGCQEHSGKTDLMLNMVLIRENYHQMADVVRLAAELGIGYVNLQAMNLAGVPGWELDFYELFRSPAFKKALKQAEAEAARLGVDLSRFEFEKPAGFQRCLLPWGHFYISWNGLMAPCCAKPFPKIKNFGNVLEQGLMSTLNSPSYRQFRAQWYRNETPDFCKRCHMIDLPQIDLES